MTVVVSIEEYSDIDIQLVYIYLGAEIIQDMDDIVISDIQCCSNKNIRGS